MCVCVCVLSACVGAYMNVCVCACVRACVRENICLLECVCLCACVLMCVRAMFVYAVHTHACTHVWGVSERVMRLPSAAALPASVNTLDASVGVRGVVGALLTDVFRDTNPSTRWNLYRSVAWATTGLCSSPTLIRYRCVNRAPPRSSYALGSRTWSQTTIIRSLRFVTTA